MRDTNFNAHNEDRSLQEAAAWKRNPKGNREGSAQETIKHCKNGDCHHWTSKGQCAREAPFSFRHATKQKGEGRNETREDTRKETAKEISKGEGPKVVRQETPTNRSALVSRRGNAKRHPHAITGTPQNGHTASQKVDANGNTLVHSSTEAKLVKCKMVKEQLPQLGLDQGIQQCVEWRPHNCVPSAICSEEHGRAPTKKPFRVRYLRKAEATATPTSP